MNPPRKIKSFFISQLFVWLLISSGIGIRLIFYLTNRSLWLDEASLALNIVYLKMPEILQPLLHGQAAPPLFLVATKWLADWLGTDEFVLRAIPFISGCLALILFYPLCKRMLDIKVVPFGVALLTFSMAAIYYSSEFKQYSTDLLATVLILISALLVHQSGYRLKMLILFACLGSLTVWFSHPSVFILAGVGLAFLLDIFLGRRNNPGEYRERLVYVIAAGVICLCSFLISYFFFVRATARDGFYTFWADGFAPFPPTSIADLLWYPRTLLHIISDPMGFTASRNPRFLILILLFRGLIALIMFLGAYSLWKNKRIFGLLIILFPLFVIIIASMLELYPIRTRLMLFTLPLFYLLLAEGLYKSYTLLSKQNILAGVVIIAVIFSLPVWNSLHSIIEPESRLKYEIKPVIEYYLANKKYEDVLYVYYGARSAFKYHTRDTAIESEIIWGTPNRNEPEKYIEELNHLAGKGRVWFIFTHVHLSPAAKNHRDEEQLLVSHLISMGELIDSYKAKNASIYLYRIF